MSTIVVGWVCERREPATRVLMSRVRGEKRLSAVDKAAVAAAVARALREGGTASPAFMADRVREDAPRKMPGEGREVDGE